MLLLAHTVVKIFGLATPLQWKLLTGSRYTTKSVQS